MKNSDRVLAMAVNTGKQTKLLMNLNNYRLKQSTLEHQINMALLMNLALMVGIAFLMALANYSFTERERDRCWYVFDKAESSDELSTASFFSFYLMMNSFIPIELPVVIEIAKLVQTYFMENDATMIKTNV